MTSRYSGRLPRPTNVDFAILAILAVTVVAFGALTVLRGAYLDRPMTDAQVYFRAGWAIWANASPYSVPDDNGWLFLYSPIFAIFMVPFANPPGGDAAPWFAIPYPLAVASWYALGFGALAWASHLVARTIERVILTGTWTGNADRHSLHQPWWFLRVAPIAAYLFVIGGGLGRGQVSTLVLLTLVGFAALLVTGKSFWAGVALSVGTAIKIYPAMALGIAILRRDWPCVAGFATGCAVLFLLVPYLVLGTDAFVAVHADFLGRIFGMTNNTFHAGGQENVSPDMIGFGPFLYKNWAILSAKQALGPLPDWAKHAHIAVSSAFVAALVIAGHGRFWSIRRPQPGNKPALLLAVALMTALMAVVTPVSQVHYITLGIFLHTMFIGLAWRRTGSAATPLWLYGIGLSLWIAPALNMEELGRISWPTVSMYPLVVSIVAGLHALRQQGVIDQSDS